MVTTLGSVATQTEGEALQIQRKNKSRMLTISTELSGIALGDAAAAVEKMLGETDLPAGVTWAIGGAIKDQRESFGDMGLLMGMGLILVYLVMVAQFESWTGPICHHVLGSILQLQALLSLTGQWHESLRHLFSGSHYLDRSGSEQCDCAD